MKVRSPILITCCIFKGSVQYCSILAKPCLATALNGYERSMYTWPLPLMQFSSDWGTFWRSKATATIFFISATIKQLLLFSFEWEQTYYWFIIFFSLNIWTVNCHWLHSSSSAGAMYYYYYFFFLWGWTFLCIIPVTKNPISLCLKEKQICGVLWGSPSKQWSWACL